MRERKAYSRFIQNVHAWEHLEKGRMIHLLHHCVEHDITTFDSANYSGSNNIGRTFGTAMSESGLSRDEIQLISRYKASEGSGSLLSAVDDLLLNLRTDYLDLLLLREENPSEEIRHSLDRLLSQGKIMEIGGPGPDEPETYAAEIPINAYQIQFPFFSSEGKSMFKAAESAPEKITGLVWWEPGETATEAENAGIDEFCRKYNTSANALLLAWLLKHPSHLHPIITSLKENEITELTTIKELGLDAFDWQKLSLILT